MIFTFDAWIWGKMTVGKEWDAHQNQTYSNVVDWNTFMRWFYFAHEILMCTVHFTSFGAVWFGLVSMVYSYGNYTYSICQTTNSTTTSRDIDFDQ